MSILIRVKDFTPIGTHIFFNLGRFEVRGFLISSALFWLEHFGVDGLRVDAVASMLYRDYSRKDGEWVPNQYGGRENLEAISFLQELSTAVNEFCPGALLIAEESTAWPGVTRAASEGGLGFSHKWNMGWMHDTLNYMGENAIHRSHHHDQMTFGLIYAFSERFILPVSHDEVVHGKRSLLGRMPGDEWQRFANLRAYLAFMWLSSGKKFLFAAMQGPASLWPNGIMRQNYPGTCCNGRPIVVSRRFVRTLNHIYQSEPALYQRDFDPSGFAWVVGDDRNQSVFAYLRCGEDGTPPILTICNFTPVPRGHYQIGVSGGNWQEIFNSDNTGYGGGGIGNAGVIRSTPQPSHGHPHSINLVLPPLATIILRQDI